MQQLAINSLLHGGTYRIEKVLGQGGFGITYLAEQVMLGRKVAIKEFFMKELCERDESTSHVTLGTEGSRETVSRFREKFLKEARNIAKLNHPNIVRIIDVFEENGTAYYVMEYAENGSLADKVKKDGYLSEPVATRYILQVTEALDYIHQRKMNHLDIKPGNIMLNEKDEAILIDFGLSKQYDAITGNQTSTTPVGISEGYAPMEQYKQGGVGEFSPETDIYALGATFFKILTGVTPPSASDVNEDGVPMEELKAKGVSQIAIDCICKTMEGKKKDRIHDIRTFVEVLNNNTVFSKKIKESSETKDESTVLIDENDDSKIINSSPISNSGEIEYMASDTVICKHGDAAVDNIDTKQIGKNRRSKNILVSVISLCILALIGMSVFLFPIYRKNNDNAEFKKIYESNDINSLKIYLKENTNMSIEHKDSINYKIKLLSVDTTPPISNPQTYIVNGVEFKMIPVTGGTFKMGATFEMGQGNQNELPIHNVILNGFAIGETEVTEGLWEAVEHYNEFSKSSKKPITNMTLEGCKDFCKKLSQITGKKFRLPTVAEWEYAARGGQQSKHFKYSGSNNINEVAWYHGNSKGSAHNVAMKKSNELGIYDMTGNIVEWCCDHYVSKYSTKDQVNPINKINDNDNPPIECRGGSYLSDNTKCHISYRFYVPQWAWVTNYLGFRIVMVNN